MVVAKYVDPQMLNHCKLLLRENELWLVTNAIHSKSVCTVQDSNGFLMDISTYSKNSDKSLLSLRLADFILISLERTLYDFRQGCVFAEIIVQWQCIRDHEEIVVDL